MKLLEQDSSHVNGQKETRHRQVPAECSSLLTFRLHLSPFPGAASHTTWLPDRLTGPPLRTWYKRRALGNPWQPWSHCDWEAYPVRLVPLQVSVLKMMQVSGIFQFPTPSTGQVLIKDFPVLHVFYIHMYTYIYACIFRQSYLEQRLALKPLCSQG